MTFTKNIKRQLRELSGKAYQRELEMALSDLETQFAFWRQKKIDPWELEELIHKFHNITARDLYKFYVMSKSYSYQVSYALQVGILKLEEISKEVQDALGELLTMPFLE